MTKQLLERTKRGLNEARDVGRFCGGRPMTGYKFDHATRKVVPDPEKIPLVKRIFESELPHYRLEVQLRHEGINIPSITIQRIRGHPFYLGLRHNTEGKLIKADWPPIISKELWQKQQVGLVSRRSPPRADRDGRGGPRLLAAHP